MGMGTDIGMDMSEGGGSWNKRADIIILCTLVQCASTVSIDGHEGAAGNASGVTSDRTSLSRRAHLEAIAPP